jgi:hypothetical protein
VEARLAGHIGGTHDPDDETTDEERGRVTVTLATRIPQERVRAVNLRPDRAPTGGRGRAMRSVDEQSGT